jgi:serine/threonine protein kinase
MTPELWHRLKPLFHAALKKSTRNRAAFIDVACDGDLELKMHLKQLLDAEQQDTDSLDAPTARLNGFLYDNDTRFQSGELVLGRFRITRPIGRGGMGEVYEAEDLQLGTIALKTIRHGIASSSEAFERFRQEVQLARRVSGPQVCRIHELYLLPATGRHDATAFLTMEFLDGITLHEKIRRDGPLPWKEALSIVLEICEGLRLIHEKGIIHRDLKTGNIMLCEQTGVTRVVLMDFGLARDFSIDANNSSHVERRGKTLPQIIMGTPEYMAPEQFDAKPVSPATDIYALGIILYELVTALHPYAANTPVAAAIRRAKHPLPPSSLRAGVPRQCDRVIERCLEYDAEKRFQSAKEIIRTLRPPERFLSRWQLAIAAALIVFVTACTILLLKRNTRSRITGLSQVTPDTDLSDSPSLSRDGKVIAYSSDRAEPGNIDIITQRLPDGRPVRITTDMTHDTDPSMAPDGTSIVFRSERAGGGIYLSNVNGGQERLLVPHGRNPRFSPDGFHILYWIGDTDSTVSSGRMYILNLLGGQPVRIAESFRDARLPVWSPDGRWILFSGCNRVDQPMPACSDWWIMSSDGKKFENSHILAELTAEQIAPWDGVIDGWYGDRVLFSARKGSETSLWMIKLVPGDLKTIGKPEQLTKEEARDIAPSLAENGTLAYTRMVGSLHLWRIDNASHPDEAVHSKITEDPAVDASPFISPNGKWLVFSRRWGNHRDVWIKDTHSMTETLLLSTGLEMMSPVIDDSGKFLVFEARERNVPSIFASLQGESPKRLCTGCSLPTGWFNINRAVLYREGSPSNIKMIDPQTGEQRVLLKENGVSLSEASWSPKNEYLLFTRETEAEGKQIFAVRLPKATASAEGKWIPITGALESSDRPRWSGDGKTVFYLSTRDGFSCLWGQNFNPELGEKRGDPFPVMHFHNRRTSIDVIGYRSFNLSVAGDSIYFNLGESSSSIWIGTLKNQDSLLAKLF